MHPLFSSKNRQFVLSMLGLAAFLAIVSLTVFRVVRAYQTPGPFDRAHQGFCDFHNGVYFPSLAFRQGISPYGQTYAREYPVERTIPFFSPVIVAAHVPFTWMPLRVAEVFYFVWMLSLVLGIAACTAKWGGAAWRWDVFAITALAIVVMRGGQQTLFTGYFTFELVLASLIAVQYGKSRPWLSALALVIVSAKPNYVLPIALLMLCRGNFKAVVWGGIFSALLAVAAFAWIMPEGGVPELVEQIQATQQSHLEDPTERPVNNWLRVDALAVVAKWTEFDPAASLTLLIMSLLLLPAGVLLWRYHAAEFRGEVNRKYDVGDLSSGLVLLTALVAVYHHIYDVLVLLPISLAVFQGQLQGWKNVSPSLRYFLLACWLLPGFNYASSQKFLNAFAIEGTLHKLLTSLNAVVLFASWLVLLGLMARQTSRARRATQELPGS